ncbi:MAG TPA: transporter substrate-binding domain-containing protein [Caulobacteraceae bacterium]|jgi:polar amino acid transport system substrate-binding protein|nr:transporter substrate-binding domain-containing protein [Caulobacteraceae bacterium]
MSKDAAAELAPKGVLRAGINMGNFLLVTGRDEAGDPTGVAPDMAREIAARLGALVRYVPYARPNQVADAAETGAWDIGLIGAEPARAEKIAFSPAYVEIEATYLAPPGSAIMTIAEVDRPGVRIAALAKAAYDLWLERNIRCASLVRAASAEAAAKLLADGEADVLAALRPGLAAETLRLPGARILDGRFTAVQQAVGTLKTNLAGAAFLNDFVEEAKASGLVQRLVERHGVVGRLTVAAAG